MATKTEANMEDDTAAQTGSPVAALVGGTLVGIIGGAAMGWIWNWFRPFIVQQAVPGMYNLQGALIGWVAHIVHSALFGVLFTVLITQTVLAKRASSLLRRVAFGVAYGILLWAVAAGIVLPLALSISDIPAAPLVPNLHPSGLLAHLVYGLIIGVLITPIVRALSRVI